MTTSVASKATASHPTGMLGSPWLLASLGAALLALWGSLALSLELRLRACPLCFYQRTFAMSLVAVLGLGLLSGMAKQVRLGILALPLAVAALGVAAFHVWLEVNGTLECPQGMYGIGTAPQQSLAVFALITLLLLADLLSGPTGLRHWLALLAGLGIGAALAYGSCIANPPLPDAPTRPYDQPPVICRPPWTGG